MSPSGTAPSWIVRTFWFSVMVGLLAALPLAYQALSPTGKMDQTRYLADAGNTSGPGPLAQNAAWHERQQRN